MTNLKPGQRIQHLDAMGTIVDVQGLDTPQEMPGHSPAVHIVMDNDESMTVNVWLIENTPPWIVHDETVSPVVVADAVDRARTLIDVKAEATRINAEARARRMQALRDNPQWQFLDSAGPGVSADAKLAAINLRRQLEREFPTTSFSLDATDEQIRIHWIAGPDEAAVDSLSSRYRIANHATMTDLERQAWTDTFGRARIIHHDRQTSDKTPATGDKPHD